MHVIQYSIAVYIRHEFYILSYIELELYQDETEIESETGNKTCVAAHHELITGVMVCS